MRHTDNPDNYEPDVSRGHEYSDFPLKPILKQVAWFFVFIVASLFVTIGIFQIMVPGGFASQFQPDDIRRRLPPAPLPRLQSNLTVKRAIADLRAEEAQKLNAYAVDPQTGKPQIPIDRAIQIVGQKGLPNWKSPQTPKPLAGGTP